MTSLFLGHLFGGEVPAEEAKVRATTIPVDADKPAAEAPSAPEQGELRTDSDPNLGMHLRNLASDWTDGTTVDTGARVDPVAAVTTSAAYINGKVSADGLAASLEASGQGHRTLSYAVGIEPVQDLRSNGGFGNTYFKRHDRPIQEGMVAQMSVPPGYDVNDSNRAATLGKARSEEATAGSVYDTFWNGGN